MSAQNSELTSVRVASVNGLAIATSVAALVFGAATALAIALAGVSGFAVFLGFLFLASLLGSAIYVGALRTANKTSVVVGEQQVLAQGVGRGGHGFLGTHVVAVTDDAIVSISAKPWGAGPVTDKIQLSQVSRVETGPYFLSVDNGQVRVALKACPPPQVAALLAEIRKRAPSVATTDEGQLRDP